MLRVDRRSFVGAAVFTSLVLLGACSSDDVPTEATAISEISLSTEAPVESSNSVNSDLPADVTAAGVVLAATLLASGNVDDAVASGLVTPAEVDEARAAIESGTLDRWVDLAEGK